MQLFLIRHAQSANNAKPTHLRIEDPPITSVGELQSQRLANWAKSLPIDTLITSPFRRTLQTTRHIIDSRPQSVHVWHDVYERGGCFRGYGNHTEGGTGMGRAAITAELGFSEAEETEAPADGKQADRTLDDKTQSDPTCTIDATIAESGWWGGQRPETDQQARARAQQVIDRIIFAFANQSPTVVVVTHADFKRLLLAALLPDVISPRRIGPLRNTGISKLNFSDSRWELDWLNSVSHLPNKLITGSEY